MERITIDFKIQIFFKNLIEIKNHEKFHIQNKRKQLQC